MFYNQNEFYVFEYDRKMLNGVVNQFGVNYLLCNVVEKIRYL